MGKAIEWLSQDGCRTVAESIIPRIDDRKSTDAEILAPGQERSVVQEVETLRKCLEWSLGTDTGLSSETIVSVMAGIDGRSQLVSVPYDPSDFGRCFRLLQLFPEWRKRLPEVASKYPAWSKLVENWEKMEAIYQREMQRSDNSAPELYALMKELREG